MTGQWKEKVTLPPKRRTAGWSVPKTFYRELLWVAQDRGYKPGWAYFKYREKEVIFLRRRNTAGRSRRRNIHVGLSNRLGNEMHRKPRQRFPAKVCRCVNPSSHPYRPLSLQMRRGIRLSPAVVRHMERSLYRLEKTCQ